MTRDRSPSRAWWLTGRGLALAAGIALAVVSGTFVLVERRSGPVTAERAGPAPGRPPAPKAPVDDKPAEADAAVSHEERKAP